MKIVRNIKVPTGNIFVGQGQNGLIEFLSIGDYGQKVNLNQRKKVPDGLKTMPLTEKWVVTISTQYGCSMMCRFCDVPKVGFGKNATLTDMQAMIETAISIPGMPNYTKRLNVHFARMGEPTFNDAVNDCAEWLIKKYGGNYHPHPVVSTMMPRNNKNLKKFITRWMEIKNIVYQGNAGLQLSINSTDENEREYMFSRNALTLDDISELMAGMRPEGRKITLNFAVAGYTVDCDYLAKLFTPDYYIIKLTPMHKTKTALQNKIETAGDYTQHEPYEKLELRFQKAGFETLVFIASHDEDDGLITCGNAILSGSFPANGLEVWE